MEYEVLRCISSMRDEIHDTMATLLAADDGLRTAEEMIRTGGDAGAAHKHASVYIDGAQGACTNLGLEAVRLLRHLSEVEGIYGREKD